MVFMSKLKFWWNTHTGYRRIKSMRIHTELAPQSCNEQRAFQFFYKVSFNLLIIVKVVKFFYNYKRDLRTRLDRPDSKIVGKLVIHTKTAYCKVRLIFLHILKLEFFQPHKRKPSGESGWKKLPVFEETGRVSDPYSFLTEPDPAS